MSTPSPEAATQPPASTNPAADAQLDVLLCGLLPEPVACRLLRLSDNEAHLLVAPTRLAQMQTLLVSPRQAFLLTALPCSGQPRPLLLKATTGTVQGNRLTLRIVGMADPRATQQPHLIITTPTAAASTAQSTPAAFARQPMPPKRMAHRTVEAQKLDRFLKTLLVETGTLGECYFKALNDSLQEALHEEVRPWAQAVLRKAETELGSNHNDRIWSVQWGVVSEMSKLVGQNLVELSKKTPPVSGDSEMSLMRTGEMNEMIALGSVIERLDAKFRTITFEVCRDLGALCTQEIRESSNPVSIDRMLARFNDVTPDAWTNALLRPRFYEVIEHGMEPAFRAWYEKMIKVLSAPVQ